MALTKRFLKGAARGALRLLERARQPTVINRHRIFGVDKAHGIEPTALLQVTGDSSLKLAPNIWIGRDVEIEAIAPGKIEIGESTSFQHDCIVRGDVVIGSHCIFARACLVMSTTHRFRDTPEWLISDQDAAFRGHGRDIGKTVRIGEDCWFGACSAVMPGVTVGRGAIVGANTIVTRDIGPYEIHGGSPNRRIGNRLAFNPPRHLEAADSQHIPYFYEGFRLQQKALSLSRPLGVVAAGSHASLVLDRTSGPIAISGRLLQDAPLQLRTRVNGSGWQDNRICDASFHLTLPVESGKAEAIPAFLRDYTVVELHAKNIPVGDAAYGISEAKHL